MINKVLTVFDVDDFSQMKGKIVYVIGKGEGLDFHPCGFERLHLDSKHGSEDNICDFNKIREEFIEDK